MSGRPANFSPEQIQALRRALREYHERQKQKDVPGEPRWTQARMAALIGVSQQVVGELLSKGPHGLQNPTALAIIKLEGFTSLDEFFAAHTPSNVDPKAQLGDRDLAVVLARRAGLADAAIDAVLERYNRPLYDNRPTKWWMAKFITEDDELDLMRRDPDPTEPPPAAAPARIHDRSKAPSPAPPNTSRRRRTG